MKMDLDSELSENEEISDIEEAASEEDEANSTGKRPLTAGESSESKRLKPDDAKQTKKDAYYKPPTTEELNYLKETESLYNSNLFRLQIEELLAQINLKSKRDAQIKAWWNEFQAFIKSMKPRGDVDFATLNTPPPAPASEQQFVSCLTENKINFATDEDVTLQFESPESVELFGAYSLNASTKTDLHFDVSIKMPRSCFREKDYLNNRYFIKRHFYTVYVFTEFRKTQLCKNIRFSYYGGHKLMPFVQLTPGFADAVKVNVHVSGPEHVFKLHRFRPDKNNVKIDLFDEFYDVNACEFEDLGTPLYNSLMARDLTLSLNYSHMQTVLLKLKNVQDGIKLAKVWLRQRELEGGLGGFEPELVFYCIAYLVAKKKINQYMSSYQVVRVFWAFLCETNWHEKPLSLADDVKDEVLRLYKENYELTFLDYSGFYNVASFLNVDVYLKVKSEAQAALNILDENKFDSFHSLFITRVPFSLQCDAILKLRDSENFNSIYETADRTKKWKFYGFYKQLILSETTDVLKRGLTKRASNIIPHIFPEQNELQPGLKSLTFGLILNPAHAFNVIEKGPLEDDPKSRDFSLFWKGLSDLRRFEDGTVREAVYFEAKTIAERRYIFLKILEFVVGKFKPVEMKVACQEAEQQAIVSCEDLCLKIKGAYDDLGKKLRELKLPLAVTSVQGTSDSFSYTECRPPEPTDSFNVTGIKLYKENYSTFTMDVLTRIIKRFPKYIAPLELVIQLGMSSKWPSDLSTLQHMKIQFYFEISKLLSAEHGLLSVVRFDHLDVLHQGLVFRLRIFVPKELQLAKKCISSEGVVSYKDSQTSLALEKQLEILPKVTSALHGIQMRHPSFGPSTAIIKRWVRSQLLDDSHIPDVVLNLLNTSLYLNPGAFSVPNLPQVAFVRFLKFLAEVDWNLNPIVVNFNNDIDCASLNEIEVNFQQNRHSYPPLCIIMPYDFGRSVFTKGEPSKEVLRRLSLLGAEAYKITQGFMMEWSWRSSSAFKLLFVPNLQGYDLLIYLLRDSVLRQKQKSNQGEAVFPIVGFNHVQLYLQHLRKMYGKFALFFHDTYKTDKDVIGILWKKKALEVTDFKVLDCSGMKCVGDKLELNKEALIHDFFVCGEGLVATIKKGS